jgi:hypothetical protein
MQLELKNLRIDGGTQPRAAIDEETVAEYAEALREGITFPPVVAFHDGSVYWLADGFHRYHAHRRAGLEKIEVDVRDGMLRDAILHSVGANTEHGLRRTNEDKRKAVITMLTHELVSTDTEGHPWTNCEIARRCRVTEGFVRKLKAADTSHSAMYDSNERAFVHPKTGQVTTMDTANIRRANQARQQEPPEPTPIAKGAFMPCKFHGEDGPVPMRTINLPLNNPDQAARSLISVYGEEYVRKVNARLNHIFQNERKA